MFKWEIDNTVWIEDQRTLEAAMSTDPKMQKMLREFVRQSILEARRAVAMNIKFANGDPRNTRQAINMSVYRKVLGGNINILNSRKKGGGKNSYQAPKPPKRFGRGGNRMARSPRTQQILDYPPFDREFILRFVDSGTKQRFVGFRNERRANRSRYLDTRQRWAAGGGKTGNRGAIASRGFFSRYGDNAMRMAAEKLAQLIETEMKDILNKQ